jgi:uncharacterized membrane protein YphA (DoxX/SURF4 family)
VLRFIERRLDKQVSAVGLAVFRIAYGCVLFLEVAQLYYFRRFFFDPVPYVSPHAPDLTLPLIVWLVVIGCLIVGAFTRPAAIVNYAFTLVSLSRFTTYEYHHDYIMIGVNFLLMFLPVGRRLSVDRLLAKRLRGSAAPAPPRTVSVLAYEVPVFVGIALVYFDSAIHKLSSPMWRAGLGLWQPASAPYATFFDWSWFLDQQVTVRTLGILVIALEAVFIGLMWHRRARVPLLVLGVAFHLGIFAVFALPLFALGVASLFLLLVPAGWWEARAASAPAPARGPRKFAVHGIAGFLGVAVISQVLCLFESPPLAWLTGPLRHTRLYAGWRGAARTLLGIDPHAVFMDLRYGPHPQQFAVVYVDARGAETWLPVVTSRGHAATYSTGRQQVYWMHRVNGRELRQERMEDGVRRLTAFWAHRHGVPLRDATFLIRARSLKKAQGWEPGLLHRQHEQPWATIGSATWSDGRFALSTVPR